MIILKDIDAAINSHSLWKLKLKEALNTPDNKELLTNYQNEYSCMLKKWLASFQLKEQESEDYRIVNTLHDKYHDLASELIDSAIKGEFENLAFAFKNNEQIDSTSNLLIQALKNWRLKII
jgi:hypothetical protein